ncbi:uncharacterized protein LOC110703051 [Chenopodium quinoa]|uniref:uncharacterized protein LOC110703051 n=1 Tax=Chenopodium quinoa TaxID=63459 RepID=UPI000B794883|nr:uncharacterized protein LOC110703051 [Chenopodium quinoa]
MNDVSCCPWCSDEAETIHHAFFSCPVVADLWCACKCDMLVPVDPHEEVKEMLLRWNKLCSKKCLAGVALLWYIWCRRNDRVFNNKDVPHLVVLERVHRLIEDCGKYASKVYGSVSKKQNRKSSKTWLPPPTDFIKVNCDACLKEVGWMGLGVVARDVAGVAVFVGTRRIRGCWSPEIAECKAIHFGVLLAKRYGYKKVIIESDCQVVISRLSKAISYITDLDSILDDVFFLSADFDFISWSHVFRDGNVVAYHLASLVPFGCEQVWENHCPPVVSSYVLIDNLSIN